MNRFSSRAISLVLAMLFLLGAGGVSFYVLDAGRVFAADVDSGASSAAATSSGELPSASSSDADLSSAIVSDSENESGSSILETESSSSSSDSSSSSSDSSNYDETRGRIYNPAFYLRKSDSSYESDATTSLKRGSGYRMHIMVEESTFTMDEFNAIIDAQTQALENMEAARISYESNHNDSKLRDAYTKAQQDYESKTISIHIGVESFTDFDSAHKIYYTVNRATRDDPTRFGINVYNMKYMGRSKTLALTIAYPSIGGNEGFSRRLTLELDDYIESPVASSSSSRYDDDDDDDDDSSSSVEIAPPTPNLIITDYDYGGQPVAAAATATLDISFKNTSTRLPVDNVVMKLTMPEELTVASGSNTFYIERMTRGEVQSCSLDFTVIPTATASTATIKVSFTFESVILKERKQLTSETEISIPIVQPNRFVLNTLEPPTEVMLGDDTTTIEATFVNKGKGTAYNVTATIEGDNLKNPGQSQFIGNMESGKEESADFVIEGIEAGEIRGMVIVTYEDANMKIGEVHQSFVTTVFDPGAGMTEPTPEELAAMQASQMEPKAPEIPWYKRVPMWSWMTGALVLAVVGAFCLKAAHINRQKMLEAEDEDS